MANTINPSYANALNDNLVTGAAVSSGARWLALTTDTAGSTETTDYDGRIDISALFGASAAGVAVSDTAIGPYTFTAGDTIQGYAICSHQTNSIASSYLLKGSTASPTTVAAAGTATIAIGNGTVTISAV